MREEEKLARDVYLTFDTMWDVDVFANIAAAEQKHMDAMLNLIDCYGVADPVTDDTVGMFTDPAFTQLYTTLVANGALSELDALMVGALIEEMDIVDLQDTIANTAQPNIIRTYENLLRGSRNHLRAFDKLITLAGAVYVPQYLTQAEYDAIVNSPVEQGKKRQLGDKPQPQEQNRTLIRSRLQNGTATQAGPNSDPDAAQEQWKVRERIGQADA
jgi:hypothetical protein